jgi:non-specific serine/threonine protein kinase
MDDAVSFGHWLKQRRKALDLTQERLAEQVNCAVQTIRKLESNARRPSRQLAEHLAAQLLIAPDERAAFLEWARRGAAEQTAPSFGQTAAPAPWRPLQSFHNVPTPFTSMIGRTHELHALRRMLLRDDVRLLTLVGPPGVGKTRLALELARACGDAFPDGVWWVPLAAVEESSLMLPTLAQTLHVKEQSGQQLIERLHAYLYAKHLLVVLDNFEQLVHAAPQVAELLAAAPRLTVLVTSRMPLHVSGEHEYGVPPLALPDLAHLPAPSDLVAHPAIGLFVERAQAVKADFAVTTTNAAAIAHVCALLDGLPLAIELAAARSKVFPPHTLLERAREPFTLLTNGARDLPPRHQTLWNALDWSYTLLDEEEQQLFRRLGVFAGGWTMDAAAAVGVDAAPPLGSPLNRSAVTQQVFDGVVSLADKSLVRHVEAAGSPEGLEPRFEMLSTIREYALEQLARSGDAPAIHARHAQYYFALAEAAEPQFTGSQQTVWLERLEQELANIRAALAWSLGSAESAERGMRVASALWWFWRLRGHHGEGEAWVARCLAASGTTPSVARATALNLLGDAARAQHKHEQAERLLQESLVVYQTLGNQQGIAEVLSSLGYLAQWQAQGARARAFFEESLALLRALNSQRHIAWVLNTLGEVARGEGDYAAACRLYEQSLAVHERIGNQRGVGVVLHNLGYVALAQQDVRQAAARFRASLELFQNLGDNEGIAWCFAGLAGVGGALGHGERAARLLGMADELLATMALPMWPLDRLTYERIVSSVREQLDEAAFVRAWNAGRSMTLDAAIAYALASDAHPGSTT